MATIIRQTAHKVWIKDIINSNYVKQEGWDPNYIELDGKKVSRVNVIATAVSKFVAEDGNYGSLTLDDGTETIRVKAFGPDVIRVKDVKVGAILRFVGKLKSYSDETYLSPEVVRELEDPNWIIVRKLELGEPKAVKPKEKKSKQDAKEIKQENVESKEEKEVKTEKTEIDEAKEQENLNQKLLDLIKAEDKGDGAEMTKVIELSKLDQDEAKNILVGLLKSGDVYEPKKGMLKVLE